MPKSCILNNSLVKGIRAAWRSGWIQGQKRRKYKMSLEQTSFRSIKEVLMVYIYWWKNTKELLMAKTRTVYTTKQIVMALDYRCSPSGTVVKGLPANAGEATDARDKVSIQVLGRFPGAGICIPHQYSCLENSMDRGAWQLQFLGLQRVGHDWTHAHWTITHRIK